MMKQKTCRVRVGTGILMTVLLGVGGSVVPAHAAPCTWGTQCMTVTMSDPATGGTLSGTVPLAATARVTQPTRGSVVAMEWWLYHPDFARQVPQNGEGKILLAEVATPSSGTTTDGTYRASWTVSNRMTTRDGAYDLDGTRTYTLPPGGGYTIEAHALDQEWVRTWGGPPGRSAPATVSLSFGTTAPPTTPPPTTPPPLAAGDVRIGTAVRKLTGTNIPRAAGALVRYTGTRSPANQYGVEVAVGPNNKVTAVSRYQAGMAIPAGGYVLSGHDESAAWLTANAPVGATIELGSATTPPPPPPPPLAANEIQIGAAKRVLNGTNVARQANYLVRYTGTASPANQWGYEVAVGPDGKVSLVSDLKPGMAIPAGGYVLSGHDESADWLRQYATIGATVTLPGTTTPPPTPAPTPTPTPTPTPAPNTPPPANTLASTGRWSIANAPLPARAMHSTLLRDGRVLLLAGSGNDTGDFDAGTFKSAVWNPTTGAFKEIAVPYDMFCAGHVTLPDGRVLISGGTDGYAGHKGAIGYIGSKTSYIFDPATDTYSKVNDTIEGHWYPTLTKLENGNIWSVGGYDNRDGIARGSTAVEMFNSVTNQWQPRAATPQTSRYWGTYPHFFLMANGNLFFTGGHTFGDSPSATGSVIHNWRQATSGDVPGLRDRSLRDQASSVLLPPAQNQTFMIAGGGSTDRGGSTNSVDLINLNSSNPAWIPGPALPGPEGRMYVNLTTLPDRTVLSSNGSVGPRAGDVQRAATYNPATNAWTPVAADPVGRNYHSSSLVLMDGRVAVFGSNPADGSFEMRVSVYEPGYFFKGTRPTITAAPGAAGYGGQVDLGVTGEVVSASLTALGSATHQTDTNARLVDLPITGTGTTRRAIVPSNPALLPPGPYMLTVLDSNGVPSVARMVNIR